MTLALTTERLLISPIGRDDIDAFVAYRREPEVARYQTWSTEYAIADAEALIAEQPTTPVPAPGEWVQLGLRVSSPDSAVGSELVGDVAVGADASQPATFELGVTLAPRHQGKGFAAEALSGVIDLLMSQHEAHRIVMQGDARNDAVLRLMTRLGLRHEGSIVEGDWFKGEWTTLERYALLRREWRGR